MEIELSFGRGVLTTGVWPALPKVPKIQAFFFSLYLPPSPLAPRLINSLLPSTYSRFAPPLWHVDSHSGE